MARAGSPRNEMFQTLVRPISTGRLLPSGADCGRCVCVCVCVGGRGVREGWGGASGGWGWGWGEVRGVGWDVGGGGTTLEKLFFSFGSSDLDRENGGDTTWPDDGKGRRRQNREGENSRGSGRIG